MNLRKQFEKEFGCQFDYEFKGTFPHYKKKQQKWGTLPRGQVWKAYAEWLEKKLKKAINLIGRAEPEDSEFFPNDWSEEADELLNNLK